MSWRIRTALRLASLSLVATIAGGLIVGSAAPAAPRQSQIRLGAVPTALRGQSVVGGLASDTPIHLAVVLKGRDPAGAASFARQVATPGSPFYHDYLTPQEFGLRFGATDQQLRAVVASLQAHGLKPGAVPADRLSVPVTASAGEIERAFSLRFQRIRLAAGRQAISINAPPALDTSIAGDVQAVIGLTSTSAPQPLLQRPVLPGGSRGSAVRSRLAPRVQTGGPQPCAAASGAASQQGAYTADQIASAYGFSGMYAAGDKGQGVTVAIYELEPDDPADIAAYQACYGTNASIGYLQVDGGAGSGEGSGEAALDIENAVGLAPRASYLVYQGPNANQSVPGSGPYDIFSAIINQDRAQVISVSWGDCEQLEGSSGASAENTLFEQAAIQGQSIVSAAGDEGSEDCNDAVNNLPDTQLAVDDPSSQPFVTGVGGTTMTSIGPPPAQTVWNNGGGLTAVAGVQGGAGGGGVSALWGMPGYQAGAASSLHVINGLSSGSQCGAPSGSYCREVPDVSADADPSTGYLIYYNGSGSDPTQASGWQAVGGTSAAAPVWAAALALADASKACHGSQVGFANPALYRAAQGAYGDGLDDITSGNNDFTGTNGGRYPAGVAYDMASGLGTPDLAALAPQLCADTLRIAYPGTQTSTLGRRASLRIRITGPVMGKVRYLAAGLPNGLSISSATGQISGRPKKVGHFVAVVVALDQALAVRGTAFEWTVEGPLHVRGASLTRVGASRPSLHFTVLAGTGEPGIKRLVIAAPPGLRFATASAISVTGAGGSATHFRARPRGGRLILTLPGAPEHFSVRISYPALLSSARLAAAVRAGRTSKLTLTITTTDAAGHRIVSQVRVRPHG